MKDQVDSLNEMGGKGSGLLTPLSFDEVLAVKQELQEGRLDLLYIAPERLTTPSFFHF